MNIDGLALVPHSDAHPGHMTRARCRRLNPPPAPEPAETQCTQLVSQPCDVPITNVLVQGCKIPNRKCPHQLFRASGCG